MDVSRYKAWLLSLVVFAFFASPLLAQNARLQLIQNSGDIDANHMAVVVDGDTVSNDFSFRTATGFMEFTAGSHDFEFVVADPSTGDPVTEGPISIDLAAGMTYVGMISGISALNIARDAYTNPDTVNRDIGLTVILIPNAREAAQEAGKLEVAAFHGATDAPAVDVIVNSVIPLVDNLDYGQSTVYLGVDPGVYTFDVTDADDNNVLLGRYMADLSSLGDSAAVIFASGFLVPEDNEGASRINLLAALPSGTVVTFDDITPGEIGDWQNMGESDYLFDGFFGPDTLVNGGHAIEMDGQGRLWIGNFNANVRVVSRDGTEASFSPITEFVIGLDTVSAAGCRGLSLANDGNIIFVRSAGDLVKIDVETGEALGFWKEPGGNSLVKAGIDSDGLIYTGLVVGFSPIYVLDPDFLTEQAQIALASPPGFGRGIDVSANGRALYISNLAGSGGVLPIYTTEDYVTYTKTDSVLNNTDGQLVHQSAIQTMDWSPDSVLWVSVDNASGGANNDPNALVQLDFGARTYTTLSMPDIGEGIGNGPRGVAFTAEGDTAYAIIWDGNRVMRFVRPPAPQVARLQLIQNSGDIDANNMAVIIDGDTTISAFAFRTATEFMEFEPGSHDFEFVVADPSSGDPVTEGPISIDLQAGVSYVGMISGISALNIARDAYTNPDTLNRNIGLNVVPIPNVREMSQDAGKSEVIVFHGSTDSPVLDVLVDDNPAVDNLDYGQWTSYLALDPAEHTFDLTVAEDNEMLLGRYQADFSTWAGSSAIVFASGFLVPEDNEGAQRLNLLAALTSGDVVAFEDVTPGEVGDWQYAGPSDFGFDDFFGADTLVNGGHAIEVDGNGRIWVGNFNAGTGLKVMNPDGSEAPFSPIFEFVIGLDVITSAGCRGLSLAKDGNIIFVRSAGDLVKIDVETGEALGFWKEPGGNSLVKAGIDSDGLIYTGLVVGFNPIYVLEPDFLVEQAQITLANPPGFGRGIDVSANGRALYISNLAGSGGELPIYTTEDFVAYTKTDSVLNNTEGQLVLQTAIQTMDWSPDSVLWVSVDNASGGANNEPNALVQLDFAAQTYTVLSMPEIGEGIGNGARGVAFTADGDTAYAISWDGNRVFRFVRGIGTGVEEYLAQMPENYELDQNYPNPFNPTTTITFGLPQKGEVTLKVYNIMGREVMTLYDQQEMKAGRHDIVFDATRISSGIYFYKLSVNGNVMTKKMTLLK